MNRIIIATILLFSTSVMAGLPPTTLSGQSSATRTTTFNFKTPYSQSTVTGAGGLVETGSENMLVNPGFEASTLTGWTCTTGTCTVETTVFSSGKQAMKVVPTANVFDISQQVSTPANIQKQGAVGIIYNIPATCSDAQIQSKIDTVIQNTVPTANLIKDGAFHTIEIPVVFGSTSATIRAFSTSACTGNIYFDAAYVKQGLGTQNLMLDNVYSAEISSTGVVSSENKDWLTAGPFTPTGTSVYAITFNSGLFTVAPNCVAKLSSNSNGFATTSTAASTTGITITTYNATPAVAAIAFTLVCQKSGNDYLAASGNVYTASSANYDWTTFTPTLSAGFGAPTLTNVCKRKRDGGDMLIACSFQTGTTAASIATMAVPDSQAIDAARIVAANISSAPGQVIGRAEQSAANADTPIVSATGTSTSLIYFGSSLPTANKLIPANGNAGFISSTVTTFNIRIPISGWSNSASIVGSFAGYTNVPGYSGNADTFSVSFGTTNETTVCSASPCSYLDQIGTAASSITRSATGTYSLNLARTYTKLKCQINGTYGAAFPPTGIKGLSCSACSALPFTVKSYDGSAAIDIFGSASCIGTY